MNSSPPARATYPAAPIARWEFAGQGNNHRVGDSGWYAICATTLVASPRPPYFPMSFPFSCADKPSIRCISHRLSGVGFNRNVRPFLRQYQIGAFPICVHPQSAPDNNRCSASCRSSARIRLYRAARSRRMRCCSPSTYSDRSPIIAGSSVPSPFSRATMARQPSLKSSSG